MNEHFTRGTFTYFEEAASNSKNLKWFEKNRERYEEDVRKPFRYLIKKIDLELGDFFPAIRITPSKLCRPVYPENHIPEEGTLVRADARAFFSERATSKYEWNPGIYIGIGKEESFLGVGLYRPTSRQMRLLRSSIMENPRETEKVMNDKKLRASWGNLTGDKFSRFPKEFNEEAKCAQYLWQKQFYFQRTLTRKEVLSRDFSDLVLANLSAAVPFVQWVRDSVGVYERERA